MCTTARGQSGPLYTHPYPVSESQFLVSYKADPNHHYKNVANAYALYLIDTEGNHRLVHKDETLSLWHPTPLVAREVPPEIHAPRDPVYEARNEALCIVSNVYEGMKDVRAGGVKWLRINEGDPPRYWDTGAPVGFSDQQLQLEGGVVATGSMGRRAGRSGRFGPLQGAGPPGYLLPGPRRELPGNPSENGPM